MRRKNRKWVAIAVAIYLGIMYSAYRWGISQRMPEGNIFVKQEREGIRRLQEEKARQEAAEAAPKPTGEARFTAAGPAYVAARYDDSHVVFVVAADTESRFSPNPLIRGGNPTKISGPEHPAAPLAGLQELWEPDQQSLHFFPKIIQATQPGDQWILSVSPSLTIPVSIDRVISAPAGCTLALGFLASVPPDPQKVFAASGANYFAVRRNPVAPADPPVHSNISELPDWNVSRWFPAIENELNARMKQEVSRIDAELVANAGSPGSVAAESPIGSARPRLKEWLHADHGLLRGEGKTDYDVHAYTLTPDGAPRLYVRARWTLAGANVFLMTAWFKQQEKKRQAQTADELTLLFADSSWSKDLREGVAPASLGDHLDFQTILNEFDADSDGWAELLVHARSGNHSTIAVELYSDQGLIPIKQEFRRDIASADACLDP
ncbi:MAG TPA: hypothetical protein VMH04_20480 [Candidatus Solibacter sp.]|nr:hypothetical protein [Candidatus Solibacter sp.]